MSAAPPADVPFPMLEARGLIVLAGGVPVLDVPSFAVARGETVALIGPNGAGKSTLLLALSSLIRPDSGSIFFAGEKVFSRGSSLPFRRRIAMVFQEPLLLRATVLGNVTAGLFMRGVPRAEAERRGMEALGRFRIGHLRDRSSGALSGGEAQRTSLARALAVSPEVLLLDEPFASLDPPTRDSLVEDLGRTLRETGTTTVIATHDREEALRLADRLTVLIGGRIAQEGAPSEVMNRPVDEEVAAFVGVETLLEGRVAEREAGTVTVVLQGGSKVEALSEAAPGEKVLLCIRPENVTLSLPRPAFHSSARNAFSGVIRRITLLGPVMKVSLDCGFPLTAFVTHHSYDDLRLGEGLEVLASVKATAIHVIPKGMNLDG